MVSNKTGLVPAQAGAPVTTDLVVNSIPTTRDIAYAITNGVKLTIADNAAGEASIVARVAGAQSADDVFGGGELVSIKDVLGTSLKVEAIESVRPSDFASESGLGVYLVVRTVDLDGESRTLAVGSTDAIVKLVKLNELGALPRWVAFEQATKATKSGYYPVNLVDRHAEIAGRF
jgi:hypothetical protein